MKHTEGEWYWKERGGTIYVRSNSSKGDIAHIFVKGDTTKFLSEKVANTQIITAAPRLLKACKTMQRILLAIEGARGLTVEERNSLIQAETSIAKAEGE